MSLTQVQPQMSLGGPAFSAYASNNQTVTTNTYTKIAFNTSNFDTNSNYSTSNYRFTPTVAGYYQINGAMQGSATSTFTLQLISIYKNGSLYANGTTAYNNNAVDFVSSIVYLNGSTDYVELWGVVYASGTCTFNSGSTNTYFNGSYIRSN
jgi:hypothetical protein